MTTFPGRSTKVVDAPYRADPHTIERERLMLMIGYVGKGRFARQLAERIEGMQPPQYIADAINHVASQLA